MAESGQQPIFILPEGYQRHLGREAHRQNIMAAKIVAETIRTTLGPKGMDKMLVDTVGDVVITNDGVTILKEMEIENPAAKMMVEIAETQEEEVGDGTTTAVVIAGELLKKAEDLLEQDVHPTIIAHGFKLAAEKATEVLENIAIKIDPNDKKMLQKIVETAMTGKGSIAIREKLNELIVDAVKEVAEETDGKIIVDLENIKLEKKTGGSVADTQLIQGIIIDKERVHSEMPTQIKEAKILVLETPLEAKEADSDTQIRINTPEQLKAFVEDEERQLKEMVKKITTVGANVVFCQKGVDDVAQHLLAKEGIFVCRRVKESDIKRTSKATGAKIVSNVEDLTENDLGYAGLVEEKKIAGEAMTFVNECKNPKAVTILIRGGTEHVVDEVKRAIEDSIGDVAAVLENSKIVAGGGAPETEVAKEIRNFASTLGGREQLAAQAFADALESIPRTLAENAGHDPIDVLVNIKASHQEGNVWAGVNVETGNIEDMMEMEVLEPLKVKTQAINSASEVAIMILRIDDVIAAGELNKDKSSGMPRGMPGMGM